MNLTKAYLYLNRKTFTYITEGARMLVYTDAHNPRIVLKIVGSAKHLADRFAGWGLPLDRQPWASVKGDAIASAEQMLNNSIASFYSAQESLNGLAAPFIILDGRNNVAPNGSLKLRGQDGSETELNFRNMIVIMQQKIKTFEEFVPAFMKAGRSQDLEGIFKALVDTTIGLWKRGLFFEVFNFHNDFGIDDNNNVFISDLGELTDQKDRGVSYLQKRKMFSEYAYQWLSRSYPELSSLITPTLEHGFTEKNLEQVWASDARQSHNRMEFDMEYFLGSEGRARRQ